MVPVGQYSLSVRHSSSEQHSGSVNGIASSASRIASFSFHVKKSVKRNSEFQVYGIASSIVSNSSSVNEIASSIGIRNSEFRHE
jgi:hypothetical protein